MAIEKDDVQKNRQRVDPFRSKPLIYQLQHLHSTSHLNTPCRVNRNDCEQVEGLFYHTTYLPFWPHNVTSLIWEEISEAPALTGLLRSSSDLSWSPGLLL